MKFKPGDKVRIVRTPDPMYCYGYQHNLDGLIGTVAYVGYSATVPVNMDIVCVDFGRHLDGLHTCHSYIHNKQLDDATGCWFHPEELVKAATRKIV